MGEDEAGTHRRLMAYRREIDVLIANHDGRVVGTAGDSVLGDFPSVIEALGAAVDIQKALAERNAGQPAHQRLEFRIGINLGDVIVDSGDIFGDGVNVAARLEAIARPGGICISSKVYDEVRDKLELSFRDLGTHSFKNITEPVHVYSVEAPGAIVASTGAGFWGSRKRVLGVGIGTWTLLVAGGAMLWFTLPRWKQAEEVATRWVVEPVPDEIHGASESAGYPAIAVLPFENQSGDADRDYFNDGVTQDVIAALGRFSNLVVMSWDAVLPYRSGESSLYELKKRLNVRYVLRGTVLRVGDRVRVTVQLTDAARGSLLWSERYDQRLDDIFSVQDKITRGVVGALAVKLTVLEQARAFSKPTDSLAAYDYVLRARQLLKRRTRSANFEARELLEEAIELDPTYAAAYARLAETYYGDAADGWTEWPHRALESAEELAQKAVALNETSATAHAILARAYSAQGQHELALNEIDRSIELNPNDPANHAHRGFVMLYSGRPDEAIRSLETALRFDPNLEPGDLWDLSTAYYLVGRLDDAISMLARSVARYPDFAASYIILAAAHAEAGHLEDARSAAASVRRLNPFFEIDSFSQRPPFHAPIDRERVAAALHAAGLN